MNKLTIETLSIDELTPYEKNAKLHPQEQIEQIKRSIMRYGMNDPIGIYGKKNTIVEGHGRWAACKELGIDMVPVIRLDHMSETDVREYILVHNQTTLNSGFDVDRLFDELKELNELDSEWDAAFFDFDIAPEEEPGEAADDNFDVEAAIKVEPISKRGQVYQLGEHRLMVGDSTSETDVRKLMNGEEADLVVTDPPYNVAIENSQGMTIENDNMSSQAFNDFLTKAFKNLADNLKAGGAFYVWFASREHVNFETALNNNNLQVRQELIWNKNSMILGRQDYQWKHEPCQPAGTKVLTTKGTKNIEDLTEEDRVISWDKNSGQVKGYKNGGYKIKTANRQYNGIMYEINVGNKKTKATDNHQFSVRFNSNAKMNYCTYLMKRGKWWRVGIAKAYDARQFGMKTRYHQEKAEAMWIIGVYKNKIEAQVNEQILSVKYGIPYTIWETDRFNETQRTPEQIESIYAALNLEDLNERALKLLNDFKRNEKYPFICETNKAERFSTRVTAKINACNIVPEIMQLPIPAKGNEYTWESVTEINTEKFSGCVYSLAVQNHEHYIADGIITHNCLYGWKDGAPHYFIDDRTQTTIIEDQVQDFKKMKKEELVELLEKIYSDKVSSTIINEHKPAKNDLHPTMKPVPLLARSIKNSSKIGERVLDLFGGSGSTLITCEQLKRKCYMMEYDPVYADVIIMRWEKFTGKTAVLLTD